MTRALYLLAAWSTLILGVVGAFVPLLPTTPFLLLSSYCFARTSPAMRQWLLNHAIFGKYLRDWEERRGVRRSVKILAVSVVLLVVASIWLIGERSLPVRWIVTVTAGVGLFVVWRLPVISESENQKAGEAVEVNPQADVVA